VSLSIAGGAAGFEAMGSGITGLPELPDETEDKADNGLVRSFKSRLCERSEAISQFISTYKIEIAASLRSSQ
jgi:hypothetical protein